MKTTFRSLVPLLGLLLVCRFASALTQQMQEIEVKIAGAGEAIVQMSSAWTRTDLAPQMLQLTHSSGAVSVQMNFIANPAKTVPSKESLDKQVLAATRSFMSSAVEKKVEPAVLKTNSGRAAYVTLTDARLVDVGTPAKGDYRYMNTGIRVTEKYIMVFTILTNVKEGDDLLSAFQIIGEGVVMK